MNNPQRHLLKIYHFMSLPCLNPLETSFSLKKFRLLSQGFKVPLTWSPSTFLTVSHSACFMLHTASLHPGLLLPLMFLHSFALVYAFTQVSVERSPPQVGLLWLPVYYSVANPPHYFPSCHYYRLFFREKGILYFYIH